MKKLTKSIFLASIACFMLVITSCSKETTDFSTNENSLKFVSPQGFKIAQNLNDLESLLKLPQEADIVRIQYDDSTKFNAATIIFKNNSGVESSVVIVRGSFKYIADLVEHETLNESNSQAKLNDREISWIISCSGCENCGVSSTIGADDSVTYRCGTGQTCCVMKISKSTSLEP